MNTSSTRVASQTGRSWTLEERFGWRSFLIRMLIPGFLMDGLRSFPIWNTLGQWATGKLGSSFMWLSAYDPFDLAIRSDVWANWAAAAVIGAVWTVLDRDRLKHDTLLNEILRIEARYILGCTLFGFGLIKLLQNEFGWPASLHPPYPTGLVELYGADGGLSRFWGFSGVSPMFVHFSGWVECIGGLLLLIPQTAIVGAVLCGLAVADIAVGLSSGDHEFVAMYLPGRRLFYVAYLLWDDWPRLKAFLYRNAARVPARPKFVWPVRTRRVVVALQIAFLFRSGQQIYDLIVPWMEQRPRPELQAVYQVERYTLNGQPLPEERGVDRIHLVGLRSCNAVGLTIDDRTVDFAIQSAPTGGGPQCSPSDSVGQRFLSAPDTLFYTRSASGLELRGRLGPDSVAMTLRRLPDDAYLFDPTWLWVSAK